MILCSYEYVYVFHVHINIKSLLFTHTLHLLQLSQCSVDVSALLHIQLICIHSVLEDVWSGREGDTPCLTDTLQCC